MNETSNSAGWSAGDRRPRARAATDRCAAAGIEPRRRTRAHGRAGAAARDRTAGAPGTRRGAWCGARRTAGRPAPDAADRGAMERCDPGRHRRTRRAGAQGIAAAWRVGRHQDDGRHGAEILGRLSGAAEQDRRRARDSRHPRYARHPARGRRSARAGRIHRHRAGLPLRQGPERRRHRLARHWRRPGDPVPDAGDVEARLDAAMEYGKKLPASNGKTGVSASAGAARAVSATRRRSRR